MTTPGTVTGRVPGVKRDRCRPAGSDDDQPTSNSTPAATISAAPAKPIVEAPLRCSARRTTGIRCAAATLSATPIPASSALDKVCCPAWTQIELLQRPSITPNVMLSMLSANGSALHVGLAWSGSPLHRRDAKRSIVLAALAPILTIPNVVFYPLTPGRSTDVAALLERGYRVCDLTAHYTDGFDDVAAHVTALDATVTIDSAPLHLGGALGRPVLAMLDHVSHWCWRDAEAQPWYDSVELFRQPKPGEWTPVVERVAARLGAMADARINSTHGRVVFPSR